MYPYRRKNWRLRALQGVLLGLGAPMGWLLLGSFTGHPALSWLKDQIGVFIYMLLGSVVAFSFFGFRMGSYEDVLRTESMTDALTGLKNVRYFKERISEELSRAKLKRRHLSLLILDLDHFKRVNDKHGHPAGDRLLSSLAALLSANVRAKDMLARVGGEEFAVMLPGASPSTALRMAHRLRRAVKAKVFQVSGKQSLKITVSVGLASSRASRLSRPESYYSAADRALFHAKRLGRNRVEQERLGPPNPSS